MEQAHRILNIYSRLIQHQIVNKTQLSQLFNVNKRTIQRDIDNIRNYFYETASRDTQVLYDAKKASYYLKGGHTILPSFNEEETLQTTPYTFEVTQTVYQQLKAHYKVTVIEHTKRHTLIVRMYLTEHHALFLCFLYRSHIRLISPHQNMMTVIDEMIAMQKVSLKNEIETH